MSNQAPEEEPQKGTDEEVGGEEEAMLTPSRDRDEFILGCGLSPNSIIGSFFHKVDEGQIVERGLVVAEPEHQVYLVEYKVAQSVPASYQRLVRFEQMLEGDWRFYDDEEWMESQERLIRQATETQRR